MTNLDLRKVFASLCTLAEHGPLPVQAYSMLVRRMCPEALSEELHRGWLADHRFAPTAADIILHVCTSEKRNLSLSSCCLALVLNDFKSRVEIREASRYAYRNSVRALFHLFPTYRAIDSCVAKCFVQPMFTIIEELFVDDPDSEDFEVAGQLLADFGATLFELRPVMVEKLILRVREALVSDLPCLTSHHRRIYLHTLDLHAHEWNEERIPEHYITGVLDLSHLKDAGSESTLSDGPFVKPKRLRQSSLAATSIIALSTAPSTVSHSTVPGSTVVSVPPSPTVLHSPVSIFASAPGYCRDTISMCGSTVTGTTVERVDSIMSDRSMPFENKESFVFAVSSNMKKMSFTAKIRKCTARTPDIAGCTTGFLNIDGIRYPIRAEDFCSKELIGKGGFGAVSRVKHIPTECEVAVKAIPMKYRESIKREINVYRRSKKCRCCDAICNWHSNEEHCNCQDKWCIMHSKACKFVLKFYGSAIEEGQFHIYMEFAKYTVADLDFSYTAVPLSAYILEEDSRKALAEMVFVNIVASVAKANDYMLKLLGMAHQDVKPQNILIFAEGTVKMCDFGSSGDTPSGETTSFYRAPETTTNEYNMEAADIHSFCLSIMDMIKRAQQRFPYICNSQETTKSTPLYKFIENGLSEDPNTRPTWKDLLQEARRYQDQIVPEPIEDWMVKEKEVEYDIGPMDEKSRRKKGEEIVKKELHRIIFLEKIALNDETAKTFKENGNRICKKFKALCDALFRFDVPIERIVNDLVPADYLDNVNMDELRQSLRGAVNNIIAFFNASTSAVQYANEETTLLIKNHREIQELRLQWISATKQKWSEIFVSCSQCGEESVDKELQYGKIEIEDTERRISSSSKRSQLHVRDEEWNEMRKKWDRFEKQKDARLTNRLDLIELDVIDNLHNGVINLLRSVDRKLTLIQQISITQREMERKKRKWRRWCENYANGEFRVQLKKCGYWMLEESERRDPPLPLSSVVQQLRSKRQVLFRQITAQIMNGTKWIISAEVMQILLEIVFNVEKEVLENERRSLLVRIAQAFKKKFTRKRREEHDLVKLIKENHELHREEGLCGITYHVFRDFGSKCMD